ncbi:hypothetical protein UT300018_06470 [Clostridium faecium]
MLSYHFTKVSGSSSLYKVLRINLEIILDWSFVLFNIKNKVRWLYHMALFFYMGNYKKLNLWIILNNSKFTINEEFVFKIYKKI